MLLDRQIDRQTALVNNDAAMFVKNQYYDVKSIIGVNLQPTH